MIELRLSFNLGVQNMNKKEYQRGKSGAKYGIWNSMKKEWQFDICEDTPMLAEARLFQKIGDDARKHRFEVKQCPVESSNTHVYDTEVSESELTETQKVWLRQLYLEGAEAHKGTASNCHIAALGSEDEEAAMFEMSAEENREFAEILEKMAKEVS